MLAWWLAWRLAAAPPSLEDLASDVLDLTAPVSARAGLDAGQRDLGVVSNFWGSAGFLNPEAFGYFESREHSASLRT